MQYMYDAFVKSSDSHCTCPEGGLDACTEPEELTRLAVACDTLGAADPRRTPNLGHSSFVNSVIIKEERIRFLNITNCCGRHLARNSREPSDSG